MLDSLKFVQGAVAKKDFIPALSHFSIKGRRVTGFNGRMALSAPIDLDLTATPKAATFVRAIQSCKDTVAMSLTQAGRLSIRSGKFRSYVECTTQPYPDIVPSGEYKAVEPGLCQALATLAPFMAADASRPWARGIFIHGDKAYATNNVVLCEYDLGFVFPYIVNIPYGTVKEIVRLKLEPIGVQADSNSTTLHYEEGRWLCTQLSDLAWPDLSRLLDAPSERQPVPAGFFEALDAVAPFTDTSRRVHLLDGCVATSTEEGAGARMDVEGLKEGGVYAVDQLLNLSELVEEIDLTAYPSPSTFTGKRVRGAIIGVRA